MTPRERVLTAFAFGQPDRVPMGHGLSGLFIAKACRELGLADEEALRRRLGDDFRRVFARYDVPDEPLGDGVVSRTIFGEAGDLIDIFFIGNDLGSQTGPLLGPELCKRFVMPHLQRLIDLGHDYGLKVQMHCCGGFEPLIPLLIDAGLDALHAVQPSCRGMDLRALKAAYGGRIVCNGAIDSHHVLIEGTPESVRQSTREVLAIMAPGGGYIAGASHDWVLEETPVENMVAMADAVREFGVY